MYIISMVYDQMQYLEELKELGLIGVIDYQVILEFHNYRLFISDAISRMKFDDVKTLFSSEKFPGFTLYRQWRRSHPKWVFGPITEDHPAYKPTMYVDKLEINQFYKEINHEQSFSFGKSRSRA